MSRKTKYTCEQKEKIVRACIEGEDSISRIARQYGISKGRIHEWIVQYKARGAAAGPMGKLSDFPDYFAVLLPASVWKEGISTRSALIPFNSGKMAIIIWNGMIYSKGAMISLPEKGAARQRGSLSSSPPMIKV